MASRSKTRAQHACVKTGVKNAGGEDVGYKYAGATELNEWLHVLIVVVHKCRNCRGRHDCPGVPGIGGER